MNDREKALRDRVYSYPYHENEAGLWGKLGAAQRLIELLETERDRAQKLVRSQVNGFNFGERDRARARVVAVLDHMRTHPGVDNSELASDLMAEIFDPKGVS